jgi:serine/threonine protein kinase
MATRLPTEFGRYRLLRKIGEGGMGAVFLAEDTQLGREVALKVPHFSAKGKPQVIARFLREARVAASVHHPNLCPVYDVGEFAGFHYLTMPFIEGTPLAALIDPDSPWPVPRAAGLVRQLALALEVMHQKGVIHRDLKPGNVLIRPDGEPVLMDFGLARVFTDDSLRLTRTGATLGTPTYMAPEQVAGRQAEQGPATDVYALGVILYELVTGEPPFVGPVGVVYAKILTAEPKPPSAVLSAGVAGVDEVCARALAKEPAERFASMTEFARGLEGLSEDGDGPETDAVARTWYTTAPRPRIGLAGAQATGLRGSDSTQGEGGSGGREIPAPAAGPAPRPPTGRHRGLILAGLAGGGALATLCLGLLAGWLLFARGEPTTEDPPGPVAESPQPPGEVPKQPPKAPPVEQPPKVAPDPNPGPKKPPPPPPKPVAPLRSTPRILAIDGGHAAVARVRVRSNIRRKVGTRDWVVAIPTPEILGPAKWPAGSVRVEGIKADAPLPVLGFPGLLEQPLGDSVFGAGQEPRLIPPEAVGRLENVHLAEQVRPLRMVIVAGSFPYTGQLDEFRDKLHLASRAEVLAERARAPAGGKQASGFRFLGVEVERQTLDADGRSVLRDWEKVDLQEAYRPFVTLAGTRTEPEGPDYSAITFPEMVMPRLSPVRALGGPSPYPPVAEQVENLRKTLDALNPTRTPAGPFNPYPDKYEPLPGLPSGLSGSGPLAPERPMPPPAAKPAKRPAGPPEHCLVRVIDVTVRPGLAYRYRLRVRMANPNYQREGVHDPADAREPALQPGPWFELPKAVRVGAEFQGYAVDQAELDGGKRRVWLRPNQTVLQFHRWVETLPGPGKEPPLLVGEWVVAEAIPIYRGEYVTREVPVEFPLWQYTEDGFVIARRPGRLRRGQLPGYPVTFHRGDPNTILVDFGEDSATTEYRGERIREDFATEVLFLTPEGKLLARNSARDARDPERIQRLKHVRARCEAAKKKMLAGPEALLPGDPLDP